MVGRQTIGENMLLTRRFSLSEISFQNLPSLFEYETAIYATNIDRTYSGQYQCIADNECGHDVKDYVATVT